MSLMESMPLPALYARIRHHVPAIEWPAYAGDIDAILRLKRERNAVILAHNYQTPEIFHTVADIVGDSLALAREAVNTDADVILLAGVHFMAETAKLLNPEKTVLIADTRAGCSLAESITGADVRLLRERYPGAPIVTYVNSSAEVKAESDICCTSGNAKKVVESLGVPKVIMLPDEYLAQNIAKQTKVEIVAWKGHCEVHERFTPGDIAELRKSYPGVTVLAHPECPPEVVIIGGGIAGLATAIRLAPMQVTLIAGAPLSVGAATAWAQGGVAAALGDDDAPPLHVGDTLKAGAGIGDPTVAQAVADAAPGAIDWLASLGTPFDRDAAGRLILGLEAAHSRRRIVHAGGDGTGRAILMTLIAKTRATPSITVIEDARAESLVLDRDGTVAGVTIRRGDATEYMAARAVVMATGGIGGLYAHTTNPLGAVGSGLAMAARAGAVLRDVEFVQFHPTAIDLNRDPMPLATEALRGEGATLINDLGERFMESVPGAELAPRDVVARAIWRELQNGRRVFLDGSGIADMPRHFPSVTALCRDAGLDPTQSPIPVRPAAHYHMGGIKVDRNGRSSVPGLWACGEVASTGLHGANRLASNSLLEALAFATWLSHDIAQPRNPQTPRPAVLPE